MKTEVIPLLPTPANVGVYTSLGWGVQMSFLPQAQSLGSPGCPLAGNVMTHQMIMTDTGTLGVCCEDPRGSNEIKRSCGGGWTLEKPTL